MSINSAMLTMAAGILFMVVALITALTGPHDLTMSVVWIALGATFILLGIGQRKENSK